MAIVTLKGKLCTYQFDSKGKTIGGGTGRVFKGIVIASFSSDIQVGSNVAVKVMFSDMTTDIINIMREESAAKISIKHPNLLRMYEFIQQNGKYHTVSEWLEGEMLDVRIKRLQTNQARLPIDTIEQVIKAVLGGLLCLHNQIPPIYHRDVKTANVMLCYNGEIKLIDFGVAKIQRNPQQGQTVIGTVLGTPEYAPPEQIRGQHNDISASSDIYALGNTIFELFVGRPPFQGAQYEVMERQVKESIVIPPNEIPELYLNIVQKSTQKKQEHRFQSVAEILAILDQKPVPIVQPPPLPKPVNALNQVSTVFGNLFWIVLSAIVITAAVLTFLSISGANNNANTLDAQKHEKAEEYMRLADELITQYVMNPTAANASDLKERACSLIQKALDLDNDNALYQKKREVHCNN